MASTASIIVAATGVPNNLAIYKGEDCVITCSYATTTAITAFTLTFTVRPSFGSATSSISKTVGSGITITDGTLGVFTITLSAADTSSLAAGSYVFDIRRTNSGSVTILSIGTFDIRAEVL